MCLCFAEVWRTLIRDPCGKMATTTSQASQYPYHALKPHRFIPVVYGETQFTTSYELMKDMPPDAPQTGFIRYAGTYPPLHLRRSAYPIPNHHVRPQMSGCSTFRVSVTTQVPGCASPEIATRNSGVCKPSSQLLLCGEIPLVPLLKMGSIHLQRTNTIVYSPFAIRFPLVTVSKMSTSIGLL